MKRHYSLIGLGIVVVALLISFLYFELYLGLTPCPLCIVDRILLGIIGVLLLLAAFHLKYFIHYYLAAITFSLAGVAVAARHLWLQNNVEEKASCIADIGYLFDLLPATDLIAHIFNTGVSCGNVLWHFFGLSIAALTLSLFVAIAAFLGFVLYKNWHVQQFKS